MKRATLLLFAGLPLTSLLAATALTPPPANDAATSIAAGKLPPEYRDWKLISVAREEGEINDIRAILGNDTAIKAYRDGGDGPGATEGNRPFPDGTIIARLAWNHVPSEENNKAFGKTQSWVAGSPKNGVQFMIKDSKKYAATGGWAYAQFDDGKPLLDAAKLKACFDCHTLIKDRDFVFTKYAR